MLKELPGDDCSLSVDGLRLALVQFVRMKYVGVSGVGSF